MSEKQGKSFLLPIVVVLGVIAIFAFASFSMYKYVALKTDQKIEQPNQNQPVVCTQEAKPCPDGSFVSRTGVNCEFDQCPDEFATWQTYNNDQYGFEFKHPVDFWGLAGLVVSKKDCNFVDFSADCPITKNILNQELSANGFSGIGISSIIPQKAIYNSNLFCLYNYTEGAAGTSYNNSFYVVAKNNNCTILKIITPYPNCQNYLPLEAGNAEQEKNYNNCVASNQQKPKTLEQIFSTFKFTN